MHSCHEHVTRPLSKTCIDWIFTNNTNTCFVHSIETGLSDHNFLSCGIYLNVEIDEINTEYKKKNGL